MTKPPITVLICGAGSRGRTVYGQFALDNPELAQVVAVVDPIEERRDTMAREHQIKAESVYSHWNEIPWAEPVAQVAIIATNDPDHLEPALAFLQAGYHVLLEKPMAPTLDQCEQIVAASERASGMSAVSHVLRYTPYFRKLKQMIDEDAVGQVLSIRHLEPVNYWHFAHSFVRGNWARSAGGTPFILAKCCHDMDILLYLAGERPRAVQSFGNLSHFRSESAPPEAALRCCDCPLSGDCAYSATKFYQGMLSEGCHGWPLDVVTSEFTEAALERALAQGPYGRCVYHCDNDVPDHQVVNLEFESGATASLVATAFTDLPARQTEVMGSLGSLKGDGTHITLQNFRTGEETTSTIEASGNHLGGDEGLLREFFYAVSSSQPETLSSTPRVSLLSHKMALLAERSRLQGRVIEF